MRYLCSKKGDLPDMLVFLVTVFVFAIGLLIFAFVIPSIANGLGIAGMNQSSEGAAAIDEVVELGVGGMQKGFFFLFVGLIMGIMITSFLIRTHPIFMFMYIFFLGITVFLATFIGNAFEQVATSPALAETLGTQGLISAVMQNIVVIVLVVGAISMIIIFSKFSSFFATRGQSQQGGSPI